MKNSSGDAAFWVAWWFMAIFISCFGGGVIYIAWHFISKVW